jgi:hypothetical protein
MLFILLCFDECQYLFMLLMWLIWFPCWTSIDAFELVLFFVFDGPPNSFFDKHIYSEFKKINLPNFFFNFFFFFFFWGQLEKMKTYCIWTLWIVSTSNDLILRIINIRGFHSKEFHSEEWFKLYYVCVKAKFVQHGGIL